MNSHKSVLPAPSFAVGRVPTAGSQDVSKSRAATARLMDRVQYDRYVGILALLWAVYFLAVFTVGRYEAYTRPVTWLGGLLLGILTMVVFVRDITFQRETWIVGAMVLWSLTGLGSVVSWGTYLRELQMLVELMVFLALFSWVIGRTGDFHWLLITFVLVGWFNVGLEWTGRVPEREIGNLAGAAMDRATGLFDNSNGFAFFCAIGVLGCLYFFGEIKPLLGKLVVILAALPCFYGVIQSASRSAFLILLFALIVYPLLCFREKTRRLFWVLLPVQLLFAVLAYLVSSHVLADTFLGERLTNAYTMSDGSSQARAELITAGLAVFLAHPLTGVGLGQVQFANGFDLFSHNEQVEMLAGMGIVGWALHISVYASVWLRLTRVLPRTRDVVIRYRVNFARLLLLILLLSGAWFRANLTSVETIVLFSMIVGIAAWAETAAGRALAQPAPGKSLGTGRGSGGKGKAKRHLSVRPVGRPCRNGEQGVIPHES